MLPYSCPENYSCKPFVRELIGLEKAYEPFWFTATREQCNFPVFLDPNEKRPIELSPHCALLEEGIPVVTGTERLFFLLCRIDAMRCKGIVGRDINRKVKLYNECNTLLLRISSLRKEYVQLSGTLQEGEFFSRIKRIADKLKVAKIPDNAKRYYQIHLLEMGDVYLNASKEWRQADSFKGCDYYNCDSLFKKVKSYADRGDIISTTGPINDLEFLNGINVSLVDISNISQSSFIQLKVAGRPRVIWTLFNEAGDDYQYCSYRHQPLSDEQTVEFNAIVDLIRNCIRLEYLIEPHVDPYALWLYDLNQEVEDPFKADIGPIYSESSLNFLRRFKANHILITPKLGYVDLTSSKDIKRLNRLDALEIAHICNQERSEEFVKNLVRAWYELDPAIYLQFCSLKGWKEAFENYFLSISEEFEDCLSRIKDAGFYDKFVYFFGEKRLQLLHDQISNDSFAECD